MTTLTTFRSTVSAIIGLNNATTGDQGFIDGWVNEGYANILRETRCMVRSASMALTAGTQDYTLDTGILLMIDAYVASSGTNTRMERIGVSDMVDRRISGPSSGSPAVYYALAGANMFMIYPPPASADTVYLYYVPRNDTLSSGAESPSLIPTEYHYVLERYVLHRAADYDDDKTSDMGERYRREYLEGLARMRRDIALKGRHRLARIPIPGSFARRVPHRNDQDY